MSAPQNQTFPTGLPNEDATDGRNPVAKRRDSIAKREEGSEAKDGAKKDTPPVEANLEALAGEIEKQTYGALLDAAIEAAKEKEPVK